MAGRADAPVLVVWRSSSSALERVPRAIGVEVLRIDEFDPALLGGKGLGAIAGQHHV